MTDDEPESSPFATRTFRVAALFLLACVMAGALVVLISRPPATSTHPTTAARPPLSAQGASTPPATSSPATTSTSMAQTFSVSDSAAGEASAGSGPAGEPSVCGLDPGDQSIPVAAPTATWQIVGNRIAAPFSPGYGPAQISAAGIGNCFADSPTGALFAMMQSIALTAVPADRISQVAVVSQRGSRTGLFDDAMQAAATEDAAAVTGMPADPSTLVKQTLLGYTFIDYTAGRATIAVAVGIGDPTRTATYQPSMLTGVVVWEDRDWKFVYSAQTAGSMAPIISAAQYTRWAA